MSPSLPRPLTPAPGDAILLIRGVRIVWLLLGALLVIALPLIFLQALGDMQAGHRPQALAQLGIGVLIVLLALAVHTLIAALQANLHRASTAVEANAQALQEREELAEQLRYREALANCSRILLVEGADTSDWETVIQHALATLRLAVGCTRLGLRLYPSPDDILRRGEIIVENQSPALPPFQNLPVALEEIPLAIRQAAVQGNPIGGCLDELFPVGSPGHTHFAVNGVRSLLVIGAHIGGIWRGHLSVSDQVERDWDEPTVVMLRTGLEMMSAFLWRWEMTNALRAREAQLRALGDNLPNGFIYQCLHTPDGRAVFTYLSSGVASILGVAAEDGMRDANLIYDRVAPEERARVAAAEHAARATLGVFAEVVRHRLRSGEDRWLYLSSRPRRVDGGSVFWDGVAIDITERQRAAEELAQARDAAEAATRAKSTFLATMSHEIRNPLNAVVGMTALLQKTTLSAEQRVFADAIQTGGAALLAVINDVLDLSRIESGRLELEAAPFDLHACLATAADLLAPGARQKGVRLSCELAPALPRAVVGDEGRLRQVLLNLLGNAVKFTSEGEVRLTATAVRGDAQRTAVAIRVRDTGIGMSEEQQERIFAPFVQAESTTTRRYGGTGLGLAITQQLVELMGGTITVSSAPSAGSTFTVCLPFTLAGPADLSRPSEAIPTTIRALRVLVAEDNPINQHVTRRMLTQMGHAVTVVADGQAALDAVAGQPYDVVLMDMQMPVLDGEEATRRIRARGQGIAQPHIIALTASALQGERERILQAGMDGYLSKPMQPAALWRALAHVAGASTQEQGPEAGQPAVPDEASLIDWQTFASTLSVSGRVAPQQRRTLITLFEDILPSQLDTIEVGLTQGNIATLQQLAHRLRGGCLQLGTRALAMLCDQLEHASTLEEAAILVLRLRTCYEETHALFRQHYPNPLSDG